MREKPWRALPGRGLGVLFWRSTAMILVPTLEVGRAAAQSQSPRRTDWQNLAWTCLAAIGSAHIPLEKMSLPFYLGAGGRTKPTVFQQKVANQSRIASKVFKRLEAHSLQRVFVGFTAVGGLHSLNPRDSAIDHVRQFFTEFGRSIRQQPALRLLRGEPCRVAICFLWRLKMRDLAQVSCDGFPAGGTGSMPRIPARGRYIEAVAGEWHFFDPPMNTGFFKRLKSSGLCLGEARFDPAFGENPTPTASLDQQKLQTTLADAITNRSDLLASIPLAKPGGRILLC